MRNTNCLVSHLSMLMLAGHDPAALILRINCCSVRTLALIQLLLARIEKLIRDQRWPSVERARNKGPGADRGQAEGQSVQHAPFADSMDGTGILSPQPSEKKQSAFTVTAKGRLNTCQTSGPRLPVPVLVLIGCYLLSGGPACGSSAGRWCSSGRCCGGTLSCRLSAGQAAPTGQQHRPYLLLL